MADDQGDGGTTMIMKPVHIGRVGVNRAAAEGLILLCCDDYGEENAEMQYCRVSMSVNDAKEVIRRLQLEVDKIEKGATKP